VQTDKSCRLAQIRGGVPSNNGGKHAPGRCIWGHAASCASATSASSPTGNAPPSFHSASACSRLQRRSQLRQHRLQQTILTRSGTALFAAEPCMSSNGSPRLNSCFAPRLSTSTLHEPATPASNHPRAPARTESLRLIWPRMPCQPSLQPLPAASKHTISRCNCRAQPPTATLQIIRTCSTIYKTHRLQRAAASFKSLYLKRPSRAPRFDYLS